MPTIIGRGSSYESARTSTFTVSKGDLIVLISASGGGEITGNYVSGVSTTLLVNAILYKLYLVNENGTATASVNNSGYGDRNGIIQVTPDEGYIFDDTAAFGYWSTTTTGNTSLSYTYGTQLGESYAENRVHFMGTKQNSSFSAKATISGCTVYCDGYYSQAGYEIATSSGGVTLGRSGSSTPVLHWIAGVMQVKNGANRMVANVT